MSADQSDAQSGSPQIQSKNPDHPLLPRVVQALGTVNDPEIKRPITELGMVERVDIDDAGEVFVGILLTTAGCPLKGPIERDVTAAASRVSGVSGVRVELGVMTEEQRTALRRTLNGGRAPREIPFARPDSLTRVICVASGKGGVGKSSVTVNLAMALAAQGKRVGVLDADIYGHSIPAMLGVADARPTSIGDDKEAMILPVPTNGVQVMSIGMLKPERSQVVAWRGPILDRALNQMLADVHWGDLDFLLVDMPPGTGDVQISMGQKLPNAEVIVVTTPQAAAAEVAERAGTMASMLNQRVIGVVENMAYLDFTAPDTGENYRIDLFGSGGGEQVAQTLTARLGYPVALLGQVPLDQLLRVGGDEGAPVVVGAPEHPAAVALRGLAEGIGAKKKSVVGMQLGLTPTGR
ncbi:sodium:proton antiporter [Enemella dayhoffiae]|uniref:Iron-sulfur cluster carrier protein n=1 Tax=Enemella dayhoffiae TaxID=2016507 RepID=A0A255H1C1_9ACTN|nr:Mrp/NBP35 family ATP-binding protein [Enemella dayhoffiae]OYO21528.1 sodium:proton antiporter [Enemella dayhoffiae]